MTEDVGNRQQLSFTWKAGYRDTFQVPFELWAEMQPQGKRSAQDFIIWLVQNADTRESDAALQSRLEVLGLKPLIEMHRQRMVADTRLIEVIADVVEQAKSQAEAAVRSDLAALRKSNAFLESTASKATGDLAAIQENLASVTAEKSALIAKITELTEEKSKNEVEIKATRDALAIASTSLDSAKADIEQVRAECVELKEERVAHEAVKNELQSQIGRIELERDRIRQELVTSEKDRDRMREKLEALETVHSELESIRGELAIAQLQIASMEATITGQKNTIEALQQALDTVSTISAQSQSSKKKRDVNLEQQSDPTQRGISLAGEKGQIPGSLV